MVKQETSLKDFLKKNGYSYTKVRQSVYKTLENSEPQTMKEIVSSLTNVDRASVYRTISLFEDIGIVQRLQMGWKHKFELSDQFHEHHHHIVCLQCGKITNINNSNQLEKELQFIAESYDFRPKSHQIEIQGICSSCLET